MTASFITPFRLTTTCEKSQNAVVEGADPGRGFDVARHPRSQVVEKTRMRCQHRGESTTIA
jgi:hypothetical protein